MRARSLRTRASSTVCCIKNIPPANPPYDHCHSQSNDLFAIEVSCLWDQAPIWCCCSCCNRLHYLGILRFEMYTCYQSHPTRSWSSNGFPSMLIVRSKQVIVPSESCKKRVSLIPWTLSVDIICNYAPLLSRPQSFLVQKNSVPQQITSLFHQIQRDIGRQ